MDAEKDYDEPRIAVHNENMPEFREHLQKQEEEEEEATQEAVETAAAVAVAAAAKLESDDINETENNCKKMDKENEINQINEIEDTNSYTEKCENNNIRSPTTTTTVTATEEEEDITFLKIAATVAAPVDVSDLLSENHEEQHEEAEIPPIEINELSETELTKPTLPQLNNNAIKEIKVDIPTTTTTTSSSPKVNGDHTPPPQIQLEDLEDHENKETLRLDLVIKPEINDIEENSHSNAQNTQNTVIPLKQIDLDIVQHSNNNTNTNLTTETKLDAETETKENNLLAGNVICGNEIEENSRDSTSNSIRSISSIKSTSPRQLVIDQEEVKVPPVRVNTKRKPNKRRIKRDTTTKKTTMESRKKQAESSTKDKVCSSPREMLTSQPSAIVPENSNDLTTTITTIAGEVVPPPTVPHPCCQCKVDSVVDASTVHQPNCPFYKPLASYYYKCSSCDTYHEKWSLFLHIHEYHDRFLCLYCIKCFPTAEKLSLHLEIKHDLEQNHFNTEEAFRNSALLNNGYSLETRFLMCCTCQHIFRESSAAFTEHICTEYMKSCSLCGQKGRHTNQCKAHPFAKRRNKKKVKEKSKISIETPTIKEVMPPAVAAAASAAAIQENVAVNKPLIMHSEDSNSSSNMVIDESCNTNHTMVANINPFKVLDECERLEKQQMEYSTTMEPMTTTTTTAMAMATPSPIPSQLLNNNIENQHQQNENSMENENENSHMFKFKLRVPKEFQKPVDELISSSESDEGSDEVEAGNQIAQNTETTDLDNESAEQQALELSSNEKENSSVVGVNVEEDESMDEEEPNLHLARILQEIEQTKLDIKRTKETIHNSHKADTIHTRENAEKNWTPTPPASPHTSAAVEHQTTNDNEIMDVQENIPQEVVGEVEQEGQQLHEQQPQQVQDSVENVDEMNKEEHDEEEEEELAGTSVENENENENENLDMSIESQQDEEEHSNSATPNELFDINLKTPSPPPPPPPQPLLQELPPPPPALILPPSDGIEVANEDFVVVELQLDRPLNNYEVVEFVRICLKSAYPICLYCNHARRIAVNAESLVLHLLSQHRFSATVDSITAEELQPETIVAKLKSFLPDLQDEYMNSNSYCTIGDGAFTRHFNERIFECFQCRFVTSTHKELYLHNRKMHLRTAILCFMCRSNFYSFSEILCHICPGMPHKVSIFEIKFRCCLCNLDNIPSPFRLMVHLRKRHFACDICLEDCRDQSKLSSHVWKHKLHHLCYRCGIAYRNKMDITKHLFWKHGTESAICKRCLNKRWPHVYHFCVPPTTFVCDVCQLCFSKAVYLTVHKRLHAEDFRYACTEENCEAKFISRKLLLKHAQQHEIERALECKALGEEKALESSEQQLSFEQDDKQSDTEATQDCEDDKKIIPKIEAESEELDATQTERREGATDATPKSTPMDVEEPVEQKPQKKKKKKRNKESLEDLNLTAPNLSESGSSSESESESKSTKCEDDVPQVMLSPISENGDARDPKLTENDDTENPVKVLDIWRNFLQAQQASSGEVGETPQFADYTEDDYPTPKTLHVCYSDHDYCAMFRPPTPPQSTPTTELPKRSASQTPHRPSSRNSNNSSSSSNVSSDESSSSNCTCGTKCSCTAESSSSSSSSSSENSDSSSASRKQQRKKTVRRHRKSESASPMKNRSISEVVNVIDTDEQNQDAKKQLENPAEPPEPTINESDLETAESESDEEYYDEHPQKLANELLSKKRAQLMARTLLSPSHNYDIVENSRPSTPSLPGDIICEKRKKKRKRERKYSARKYTEQSQGAGDGDGDGDGDGEGEESIEVPDAVPQQHNTTINMQQTHIVVPSNEVEHPQFSYTSTTTPFEAAEQIYTGTAGIQASFPQQSALVQHTRISEGSSCSDVDGSLKRSKRTRRPNKFYGYTSDDESMATASFGQSLVIGMRAFKPQPPPQLVWNKEDLPTPSKSILNNKKTPRATKRHEDFSTPNSRHLLAANHDKLHGSLPKRKRVGSSSTLTNSNRKRNTKSLGGGGGGGGRQHLPPIPRLKLRPSLFGISNTSNSFNDEQQQQQLRNSLDGNKHSMLDDAEDSSDASTDDEQQNEMPTTWRKATPPTVSTEHERGVLSTPLSHLAHQHPHLQQQHQQPLPPPPPTLPRVLPPTPQTTVFNHKIPPALLPNPDFATLQYFKANNIRYPIRPPAGARAARDGESVYCYCRCPYDEVSEMIACDGDNCLIEWFHFECVGIMVAPQGKWFCAECRPHYSEDLYPTTAAATGIIANIRDY